MALALKILYLFIFLQKKKILEKKILKIFSFLLLFSFVIDFRLFCLVNAVTPKLEALPCQP